MCENAADSVDSDDKKRTVKTLDITRSEFG